MKFFTDIVLQGVAKLKAPFIQLTPVSNASTEMSAARGALYIDVNTTNDSATDYDGTVVSNVQKQSLKFNLGTEAGTADWRDVLSSYDFFNESSYIGINNTEIAAVGATVAIRRTNAFGGRLINLNLSPRFKSEATSKAYVDYKSSLSSFYGSYTFTGTTTALTYTKAPALNLPRPSIVVTVYQITNTTTQTMEVVYPDISITRSGSGTVASPYYYNITLSFASAPGTVDFLVAYNC